MKEREREKREDKDVRDAAGVRVWGREPRRGREGKRREERRGEERRGEGSLYASLSLTPAMNECVGCTV